MNLKSILKKTKSMSIKTELFQEKIVKQSEKSLVTLKKTLEIAEIFLFIACGNILLPLYAYKKKQDKFSGK